MKTIFLVTVLLVAHGISELNAQDRNFTDADVAKAESLVADFLLNATKTKFLGCFFHLEIEIENLGGVCSRVVNGLRVEDFEHDRYRIDIECDKQSFGTECGTPGNYWSSTLKTIAGKWQSGRVESNLWFNQAPVEQANMRPNYFWPVFTCFLTAESFEKNYPEDILGHAFTDWSIRSIFREKNCVVVRWKTQGYFDMMIVFDENMGGMPVEQIALPRTASIELLPRIPIAEKKNFHLTTMVDWVRQDEVWLPRKVSSTSKNPFGSAHLEFCWLRKEDIPEEYFSVDDLQASLSGKGWIRKLEEKHNKLEPWEFWIEREPKLP